MKCYGYNLTHDNTALLKAHEKSPSSFSVQFYPNHWMLNNALKFAYNNPISSILDDIRAFRIPLDFVDIFDSSNVPFYDGCLLVELLDYRPQRLEDPVLETPSLERVVLRPTPEMIWDDICRMNARTGSKLTDAQALEVEAKILMATSAPLCLEPDPHLGRIVNSVLRIQALNIPKSLKRKATAMSDLEEDETEKAKRAKVMQYMAPQATRKPISYNYKILALKEQRQLAQAEAAKAKKEQTTSSHPSIQVPPLSMAVPMNLILSQNVEKKEIKMAADAPIPAVLSKPMRPSATPQQAPVPIPADTVTPSVQTMDRSQHTSPVKTQPSALPPQRPPSQPVVNAQPSNLNVQPIPQAPVVQGTPQPQATATFNPPIPPSNFLHPPPIGRKKSQPTKPGTPAVPNRPPSVQHQVMQPPVSQLSQTVQPTIQQAQAPNQQAQPQAHSQPQSQPQPQPQTQPQAQLQGHPPAHPPAHPQGHPQGHLQGHPQGHPQIHPQTHLQAHPQTHPQTHPLTHPQAHPQTHPQGHPQSHPQGHPQGHQIHVQQPPLNVPMNIQNMHLLQSRQAMSGQVAAAALAQRQSGRSTPATNMHSSPALSAAMTRSPMVPGMKSSGPSTPAPAQQLGRATPLITNQPLAAHNIQNAMQNQILQPQRPGMQGTQQHMPARPGMSAYSYPYPPMMARLAQNGISWAPQHQVQQGVHGQAGSIDQSNTMANVPMQHIYNLQGMTPRQPYMFMPQMMGMPQPGSAQGAQQQMAGMSPNLQQMQGMGRGMPGNLQNR